MAELVKYGQALSFDFVMFARGSDDTYLANPTFATGDTKIHKDGGAASNTSNNPAAISSGKVCRLTLTATEMQAATVTVILSDVTGDEWKDQAFTFHTYGNSSALHEADLDRAIPSATEIEDQLEIAHGTGSWEYAPTGDSAVTLTIDDGTTPIEGVRVGVYDGTNTSLLRQLTTDASGQVSFNIADGSYKVRLARAQYAAANSPESLTVSGTTAQTYSMTDLVSIDPPGSPTLCTVYDTLLDAGGNAIASATVEARAVTPQAVSGGDTMGDVVASATTDANGQFTIDLVQGAEVEIVIARANVHQTATVPASDTVELSSWLEL